MERIVIAFGAGIGAFIGAQFARRLARQARYAINDAIAERAQEEIRNAEPCDACHALILCGDGGFFNDSGERRCQRCGPFPKAPAAAT